MILAGRETSVTGVDGELLPSEWRRSKTEINDEAVKEKAGILIVNLRPRLDPGTRPPSSRH